MINCQSKHMQLASSSQKIDTGESQNCVTLNSLQKMTLAWDCPTDHWAYYCKNKATLSELNVKIY